MNTYIFRYYKLNFYDYPGFLLIRSSVFHYHRVGSYIRCPFTLILVWFAGPPSTPTLYTSNDSFVCFDAYSSPRHPVLHYNINVTDEKDQLLEDEVYSQNIDDTITKCHNIDDFLRHNDIFKVFISATNDIKRDWRLLLFQKNWVRK